MNLDTDGVSSVPNRRHQSGFAAAAAELAGDGGFGLWEDGLQAGLGMLVDVEAGIDGVLGFGTGGGDVVVLSASRFLPETKSRSESSPFRNVQHSRKVFSRAGIRATFASKELSRRTVADQPLLVFAKLPKASTSLSMAVKSTSTL